MRISTLQAFNNGVAGLQRNYANATRTQEQISTGNRILTPADDPVASVRLLQLEQQKSVLDQYGQNLTAAKNSLTQEETTLNSVNTVLQRVRELAVQAGNGALSAEDRKSIAAELKVREDELAGLMNTKNARGEYLFSGFQGKTPPFQRQPDGTYQYKGDEGQRQLQIASSLSVPISDNGKAIFENVTNAARVTLVERTGIDADGDGLPDGSAPVSPNANTAISGLLIEDEVAYSSFEGATVTFNDDSPPTYTLTPSSGAPVTGTLSEDGDTLVKFQGVAFYINGAPTGTYEIGRQASNPADAPANKVGILDTVAALRKALESGTNSPTGNRAARDAVALAITNLDNGMTTLDSVRGAIGARLNTIETTETDNTDVTLVNKSVQAELRELDYPEALSRLAMESTILQAAQQSYIKINSLNLFNFLN